VDRHRNDWKYALVGPITLTRARGRFGMTGSDRPRTRVHVSRRDWEGSGAPSVGARCPAVTVRPSKGVAVPATEGSGGRPEGHGRARMTNRDPFHCGAWVLPRPEPVVAGPGRRGSVGAKGACAASAWRTRGRVRGAVWLGWDTQAVGRADGWGTPSGAGVARASLVGQTRRGAERRRGRGRDAPASVQGPITLRQLEATEGGTGRPHTTGRHHPPPPSLYDRPPTPIPIVCPSSRLGRGGHFILAVDGGDAAGGDDGLKCGARRAAVGDGGPKSGVRRAGAERGAGQVGSPPRGGGGPHRRRGADDGRGQVGQPGGVDRSDQRGARQYGRRQVKGLHGGHSPGGWGGCVGSCFADGRHQVKWRGLGGGPRESGPPVAPGWRRDPEPGVLGCGKSGDETAAGPAAFQVNGGVGDGVPRVKCGGAVGRRGRGGPRNGGRPSSVAAQPAGDSTGGGGGGSGDNGRRGGGPYGSGLPPPGFATGAPPGMGGGRSRGGGVGGACPVDAPPRPYSVGGVSPAGPVRGHPGAEAGPGVAAVADTSPRAVRKPAGVTTDLPALLEAADAPWVERVASRLSNGMDGATADDMPPVVAW